MIGDINSELEDYDQHDANEFLSAFFEGLNEDLNRIKVKPPFRSLKFTNEKLEQQIKATWERLQNKENSFITDLFRGQLVNITLCLACKHETYDIQEFDCLPLDMPKENSRSTY